MFPPAALLVPRVSEMLGHLRLERHLQHPFGDFVWLAVGVHEFGAQLRRLLSSCSASCCSSMSSPVTGSMMSVVSIMARPFQSGRRMNNENQTILPLVWTRSS